jgi:hypothetical protein
MVKLDSTLIKEGLLGALIFSGVERTVRLFGSTSSPSSRDTTLRYQLELIFITLFAAIVLFNSI